MPRTDTEKPRTERRPPHCPRCLPLGGLCGGFFYAHQTPWRGPAAERLQLRMGHRRGHPWLLWVIMVDGPAAGEKLLLRTVVRPKVGVRGTVQRTTDYTVHEVEVTATADRENVGRAKWVRLVETYRPLEPGSTPAGPPGLVPRY